MTLNGFDSADRIQKGIDLVKEMSSKPTKGKWLENLVVEYAPFIKEWEIEKCWLWADWPEREALFAGTTAQDVGIDVVGLRASDGRHIAIQCKSRALDDEGVGKQLYKGDTDSFNAASRNDAVFDERWLVTNGDVPLTREAKQTFEISGKVVKEINVLSDLYKQLDAYSVDDCCAHCDPNVQGGVQSKDCMQREAVDISVSALMAHEAADTGGLPKGQARGKIILPCGTGKTRISLRIVERLTPTGGLSIVLCPSIALVAQIRREYLQNVNVSIRTLSVCSDKKAGEYKPKVESARSLSDDPTLDNGNVGVSEVKGMVTTNPVEIADWIQAGRDVDRVSVIFGTYQSGNAIAAALNGVGAKASVLIADEAHRTAGLRSKKRAGFNERVRDFTLCHDNDAFPATYRVYQTATPRIYSVSKPASDKASDWIVRSMDDETTFGVELYRKSYAEAVKNEWLSDYRIIAIGISDRAAYDEANRLARETLSKGRQKLTTRDYMRGLAFAMAMGGFTRQNGDVSDEGVHIKSCIAFMNTIDKSKNMARDLGTDEVRAWVQGAMERQGFDSSVAGYSLEHLDASDDVGRREQAKVRLAEATENKPHGIINVGIFGEGTDSPSLNAVAFLEARKSPIDVIQAVGRAMRKMAGKRFGYIICPVPIPPEADPETWLSTSHMNEGWRELGQILLALRAHDSRIEDEIGKLLVLKMPDAPDAVTTIAGIANSDSGRIAYYTHRGIPGSAADAVERGLDDKRVIADEFMRLPQKVNGFSADVHHPSSLVTGKRNSDGSSEVRQNGVARHAPSPGEDVGAVNYKATKTLAKKMINNGDGALVLPLDERRRLREEKRKRQYEEGMQKQLGLFSDWNKAIHMNLLSKSGLVNDRVIRDLNILEHAVKEASFHMRQDELQPLLDRHFGIDALKDSDKSKQADGCTIAALLMMNAAMLHQRIANGRWLRDITGLESIKNEVDVAPRFREEWERILRYDFRPVLEPAVEVIYAIERIGKLAGLERALRHIAAESQRIAETYADMGADHAGPLFNRVMGNQASDGAFFTRPVAASIAARLTLDALGDVDWSDPVVWSKENKVLDPACGSGTLLAAMLADMKRRARELGASEDEIVKLQRLGVEDVIKGLDINPVSLQLAASQLTAGNKEIRYRQMGLHLMPYGPDRQDPTRVSAGALELLGQSAIVPRNGEFDMPDERLMSKSVWGNGKLGLDDRDDDPDLEDAVEAAKDARIVIMNPPFTNRAKMGEKFQKLDQQALRQRGDALEQTLVNNDKSMADFVDKNALEPLFTALADRCVDGENGVLTMINPTITLSASSALNKRRILAQRFYIQTVLTCHQPKQINMSQNTSINESVIVAKRHDGPRPPTRIINLDRMPMDEAEVADLHECLANCEQGAIANGWGEVSHWPAERIEAGDWTAAVWRSPELADAAARFANDENLMTMKQARLFPDQTDRMLSGTYERCDPNVHGSFPVIDSKGSDGQKQIKSDPDEYWVPKKRNEENLDLQKDQKYPEVAKILRKAGHLLITSGQRNATARLTAVASDEKYVGNGFIPVTVVSATEAKMLAVFLNSTVGRLQLMRNMGKTLEFPIYRPAGIGRIRIPDIKDATVRQALAACYERTRQMPVPQFRDGECDVRRLWDEAVAEACGWDGDELTRLRLLLHQEPHVRGLGYGQYADEVGV